MMPLVFLLRWKQPNSYYLNKFFGVLAPLYAGISFLFLTFSNYRP